MKRTPQLKISQSKNKIDDYDEIEGLSSVSDN